MRSGGVVGKVQEKVAWYRNPAPARYPQPLSQGLWPCQLPLHRGAKPRAAEKHKKRPATWPGACFASSYFPQQCLYFLPLPQGQGSFLPTLTPLRTGRRWSVPSPEVPVSLATCSRFIFT